jgi:hypothetical protein
MGDPAVLIPSGLAKLHPQLETSIKSIAGAIQALQKKAGASTGGGVSGSLAAQVQALQAQLAALQAQVDGIDTGAAVYKAGQTLPAYCAVYEVAAGVLAPADNAALDTCVPLVGLTRAVAAAGQSVSLARNGEDLSNTVWSWTPRQPVYLGAAGSLTQVLPLAGYPLVVGWAVSAIALRVGVSGAGGDGPHTLAFQQQSPATSWEIDHGLNRFPAVVILDSSGDEVEADVVYLSAGSLRIDFAYAVSGQAFLN